MAAKVDSLLRHGVISASKGMRLSQLAKTRSQRGRMDDDDGPIEMNDRDDLDEGRARRPSGPEGFKSRHINRAAGQRKGSPIASAPTTRKGAKQRTGQPTSRHINQQQGPAWPSAAGLKSSEIRRPMAPAVKRKSPPQGGYYGGGGRDTQ